MPRRVKIQKALGLAILIFFASAPLAHAKTVDQYVLKPHHHCKASYVKKVERVKVKKHGHTRMVSETFCVRSIPRPQVSPPPVLSAPPAPVVPVPVVTPPTSPVPGQTTLHANIDPSFTRSPTDPFAVTYQYSASASEGSAGTPVASLPEGVLNLFSDGLLACSINVGGQVKGGECLVTYTKLGEHGVVVTYTSGISNGTETYVEQIEPFPTVVVEKPTTTKASGQLQCPHPEEVQGVVVCKEFGSESRVLFNNLNNTAKNVPGHEHTSVIRVSRPEQRPGELSGELQDALEYLTVGMPITLTGTTESGVIIGILPLGGGPPGEEEEEIEVEPEVCVVEECPGDSRGEPPRLLDELSLPDVWYAHLSTVIPETSGPVVKPTLSLTLAKGQALERAHKGAEPLEGYRAFYEPKEGLKVIATVSYAGTITEGPTEEFHLTSDHWLPSTSETAFTIAGK
jgi:hypothetical protein